jgi:excisionase family DNA binding protein
VLTLAGAAARLGLAPATLRHQAETGRLAAVKLGRDWLVTDSEVERYRAASLERPGRRAHDASSRTAVAPANASQRATMTSQ